MQLQERTNEDAVDVNGSGNFYLFFPHILGQAVKEKDFFCKSEFDTFEAIVRQNFDPRSEANPQVTKNFQNHGQIHFGVFFD